MTEYGLAVRGSNPGIGRYFFLFSDIAQVGSGAHPASYIMDNWSCFVGVRRSGRDVDSSSPFSDGKVKVKVTLVQALRLCTGRTAHRGSRGIALPFLDHVTRRG